VGNAVVREKMICLDTGCQMPQMRMSLPAQFCASRLPCVNIRTPFMQDESLSSSALADQRSASIKLVFKKAMLSKLGQTASSVVQHLKDEIAEDPAPETPKTTEKKNGKQAARGNGKPPKANAAVPKAAPSKATKPPPNSAPPKSASKKPTPQKQKRAEANVDASSITSELGVAVMSSTAGLDLADAAGDALAMSRVRRTMKELVGELKISNESVAAVVCSCHGLINYLTAQVGHAALLFVQHQRSLH
jgi:hypothetical protein